MRRHLLPSLLIAALVLPATPVFSAGRVDVEDTIAGLETTAVLDGLSANSTVELLLTLPTGDVVTLPAKASAQGSVSIRIPSGLVEQAGTYRAAGARDGTRVTGETQFTVLPDRVSDSASFLETDRSVLRADGADAATITVTLSDRYGNLLSGRPAELISNRPSDLIQASARETDAGGTLSFLLRAHEAGSVDLRVVDLLTGQTLSSHLRLSAEDARGEGGDLATRNPFTAQVTANNAPFAPAANTDRPAASTADIGGSRDKIDGAVRFRIVITPENPQVGDVLDLSVTALRQDESIAAGYERDPLIEAPNDPGAVLPGFGTLIFQRQEGGRDRCLQCVSFATPGPQTLTVTDQLPSGEVITGVLSLSVTASADYQQTQKIEILSHRDGALIATPRVVLEGIGPKLANLIISGGEEDVEADTDGKGYFTADVPLNATYNEYTMRVQAVKEDPDTGERVITHDSGPLHLVRDASGPELEFAFDPPEPNEGQDVALTVTSEPKLPEVTMLLANREISLSEDPNKEGTYYVVFQAPPPGKYQPAIVAKDDAGNRSEVRATLAVVQRELPGIRNLRATPKSKSIDLTWEAPEGGEATSYLVYYSTGSTFLKEPLDTKDARTSVSVMGLKSSKTYSFAVTAIQGDRKSPQSAVVSATTLGLLLTVTPAVNKLVLEWEYNDPTTPLKEYLLEFSDKPNIFTNKLDPIPAAQPKRDPVTGVTLPARQRTELPDLIAGVTYYLRLTPVTTTGEFVLDMVTLAEGVPVSAGGFLPSSPGNPLPFNAVPGQQVTPTNGLHSGAPSTTSSGLPPWAIGGTLFASAIVFWVRRRKAQRAETAAFLLAMGQRYHG